MKNKLSISIFLLISLFNFISKAKPLSISKINQIRFMSYNVENLFNAKHDKNKNDWEFVAKSSEKKLNCKKMKNHYYQKKCLHSSWTEEKLKIKLSQIKKVIESANQPDLIALEEVENQDVMDKLINLLPVYQYKMTHSLDKRGIDVVLMFKKSFFKLINKESFKCREINPPKEFKQKRTRNILFCQFDFLNITKFNKSYKLNKNKTKTKTKTTSLKIFVNHWPSLGNDNIYRILMAKTLMKNIDKIYQNDKKENKESFIIATGDFNTIPSLHPHPFYDYLLKNKSLFDLYNFEYSKKHKKHKKHKKNNYNRQNMPPGTYFYAKKMQWNMLDHFFLSTNFLKNKKIQLKYNSYQIYSPAFMQDMYVYYRKNYLRGSIVKGIPKHYNFKSVNKNVAGFSDHFPIIFDFIVIP